MFAKKKKLILIHFSIALNFHLLSLSSLSTDYRILIFPRANTKRSQQF